MCTRLLQRRLCCRMRRFKPEPQGYILRVREPVGSVCLQGSQLPTSAECSRKAEPVAWRFAALLPCGFAVS